MKSFCSFRLYLISGFVLICHLWTSVFCDPCQNAINIGDYRRSVASVPTVQAALLCDVDVNETLWYRFDALTGGKMPESCVSIMHCGTFLPIWMNGSHPTAANPGPKSVGVCSPFSFGTGDCCGWRESISVRWCQSETSGKEYFVYQLKRPPFCSMSYCAGDGLPCERNCSWNGVRKSCSCPAYPRMTEAPELRQPRVITATTKYIYIRGLSKIFFPTRFVVDCVVSYSPQTTDDGARFDVVFEVNGHYLTRMTVSSTNPVATLDESYLIGHLGKELTCKASSHWDSSEVGSRYLISNGHWFGLVLIDKTNAVVSGNLVVKEGEKTSLWLQPTFPLTTRPCFGAAHQPCFLFPYSFKVSAFNNSVKLSDCAMVFHSNSNRSVELEISPIPAVGTTPKPVIWQLNFDTYADTHSNVPISPETSIFRDYRIQSVNIEVRNRDEPPQCESIGDPHITTFPNAAGTRNYYHIYGVGDFFLVRLNSTRLLEIQVRHIPCGLSYSCTCGVIVREGNSIIGITKCNQPSPLFIEYRLAKVSPTGTIHTTPEGWKISLLSGIVINVAGFGNDYMHVYVTGIGSELKQYDGLCSASVPRDSECTSACDQYRVPASQSFFSITQGNLPRCGIPLFVPTCSCYGRDPNGTRTGDSIKIACNNPTGDYRLKVDITKVCNGDDYDSMYDDFISLDDFNSNPIPIPTTTTTTTTTAPPPPLGRVGGAEHSLMSVDELDSAIRPVVVHTSLSPEDGRGRCRESLKLSFTYDLCSSRVDTDSIVDTCALDVQLLNDYSPSKSAPTQFEISCLNIIRRSLEAYTSTNVRRFQKLKNLLIRVEKLVCPSQCSQNGRCINAACQCNKGFIGADCSLRRGQQPVIQRIFSPVCDIHKHPCKKIHLVATDLTNPTDVVCRMRSVNGSVGAVPAVQYSTPVISGGLVACSLSSMPISKDGASSGMRLPVYLVQVSISNDGQNYSQEQPFTVYDGRCMQCPAMQNASCQMKDNTCSIGGRCYRAGDRCPDIQSRTCNPSKCRTKWTSESFPNCDVGFDNCIKPLRRPPPVG